MTTNMVITTPHVNGDVRTSTAITTACVSGKPLVGDTIGAVHAHQPWPPSMSPPAPIAARRTWPFLALAGVAAALAAAALIVALTKPVPEPSGPALESPTYTADDIAVAQGQLCETYQLVARAVKVDTNGSDQSLGRIALTNGAVLLEAAAADPALDGQHRAAARALAMSYLTLTAKGNAADAEFQAALDETNVKDSAMKRLCNGS
jgi:hypothetical protein